MRKTLFLCISLIFSLSVAFGNEETKFVFPEKPDSAQFVNILTEDYIMSVEEQDRLEQKLTTFFDSTTNQIIIVVVDDLGGMEAVDFATEIGHKWGVGDKDHDNGVVILLSLGKEIGYKEYYFAIGYGLEGGLPDLKVKRIQEEHFIPYVRSGDFYAAFDESTTQIIELAGQEYDGTKKKKKGNGMTGLWIALGLGGLITAGVVNNKKKKGLVGEVVEGVEGEEEPTPVKSERKPRVAPPVTPEEEEKPKRKFGGGQFGGGGAGGRI